MQTSNHAAHHDLTKHIFLRKYSAKVGSRRIGKDKELED